MHRYVEQLFEAVKKLELMENRLVLQGIRFATHRASQGSKLVPRGDYESTVEHAGYRLTSALLIEGDGDCPDHTAHLTLTRIADGRFVSIIYEALHDRWSVNIDGDWRGCQNIATALADIGVEPFTTRNYEPLSSQEGALSLAFQMGHAFGHAEGRAA